MRSRRSKRFRTLFRDLPPKIKSQAYAAYRLFEMNPNNPGLQFKKIHGKLYSVRVGLKYRALGVVENPELIIWIWIGSHAEYDNLIK